MKGKTKKIIIAVMALIVLFALVAVSQVMTLQKAHSTFENYYAFRGCTQLLKKTNDYGICKTDTGQTIKLVLFRGRWYLDHDLPWCVQNFCF